MSKKTAAKNTKKPDPKAAGERALNLRKIAMEEEAIRIRRIVSKMLEPVQREQRIAAARLATLEKRAEDQAKLIEEHRLNTKKAFTNTGQQFTSLLARIIPLESRSAPAEEWDGKPTHIKLRPSEIQSNNDRVKWAEGLIRQLPEGHNGRDSWLLNYAGEKHTADKCVPSIADHKAKEEQRALEAEWAKFDCLQEGDACHLTDEQRAELAILFPNVLVWEKFRAVVWYQESLCYIQREIDPCDGENEIPSEHFLRRAKGTIAKRAEDERAKEMVKVPEFGTRVKTPKGEGIYLGREVGTYTIATPHGSQFNFGDYARHEFTIID